MEKVNKHSIIYKNRIAIDYTFAAKVLWTVDCFPQLFLEDCRKCLDQEDKRTSTRGLLILMASTWT